MWEDGGGERRELGGEVFCANMDWKWILMLVLGNRKTHLQLM